MSRRRPAALQRVDLIGEQHAVGGQREVASGPACAASIAHQRRRGRGAAAARRRSAGPCPRRAPRKTSTSALDLLEVQEVLARQPDVVVLRHAVLAAQVAAVGDREPQVAQRPAECRSVMDSSIRCQTQSIEVACGRAGNEGPRRDLPVEPRLQRPGTACAHDGQRAVGREAVVANHGSRSARSSDSPHAAQRVSSRSPTCPGRLPA